MNNNTNIRGSRVSTVVASLTVTVGAVWLISEIASYLPLEISISLLAIAGLLGLAYLDFKQTTREGVSARRFRRQFLKGMSRINQGLRGIDRAAA